MATPSADQLVTGEAVTLDLPAASIGLRILSGLLDVILAVVVLFVGSIAVASLAPDEAIGAVLSIVLLVGALVVVPTVSETLSGGRTLGKLVTGLRTVRDDGGPITFRHAFVRHLLAVVEVWLLSAVPAVLCLILNSRGKRVGDLVAGTYVVRNRVSLALPWPVAIPPELASWAAGADIAPLPDGLAVAIRRLVGRASTLSPGAHQQMVGSLAAQAARLVSPAPPPGTPPERFLAAVAAERRRRDLERLRREQALRDRLHARSSVTAGQAPDAPGRTSPHS